MGDKPVTTASVQVQKGGKAVAVARCGHCQGYGSNMGRVVTDPSQIRKTAAKAGASGGVTTAAAAAHTKQRPLTQSRAAVQARPTRK